MTCTMMCCTSRTHLATPTALENCLEGLMRIALRKDQSDADRIATMTGNSAPHGDTTTVTCDLYDDDYFSARVFRDTDLHGDASRT